MPQKCEGPGAIARAEARRVVRIKKQNGPQDSRSAPRLQHLAERVHRLGPRPLHELLIELVAAHGDDVVRRIERYARLRPDFIKALDGDRFTVRLAAIEGGRP